MGHEPRRQRLALVVVPVAALLALLVVVRGASLRAARSAQGAAAKTLEPSLAVLAVPQGPAASCAGPPPPPQREAFEARVVELVNAQRRSAGLPPLKRVEPLTGSARWFARDMASEDYFAADHDTYRRQGQRLVRACRWSARLAWFYPGWTSLAENIAAGYERPEDVVSGWLASASHRAKILGRKQWETGAGYWAGGSERHYWVQDFGRRDGVFPLVIDDEARATPSPRVRLYVYGSWREMRLRNDDEPYGPWRTFTASLEWTLRDEAGTRSVGVELRDGRRTATAADAIVLERPQPPT